MRPIKFRGKRLDNGEWVYGNLMTGAKWYEIHGDGWWTVPPETVGQFTDICDRNGWEIYEGDRFRDSRGLIGEVIYESGCFMVRWAEGQEEYLYIVNNFCEVVGNKFEGDVPEALA